MSERVRLAFTGLVVAATTAVGTVAITSSDGTETTVEVTQEDIQRIGRDHAEAQRKANQAAGNDWLRQSWLLERRLFEAIISARELRNDYPGPAPDPGPDSPPPADDPDVQPPDPDGPDLVDTDRVTIPGDATLGYTSEIVVFDTGSRVVAYAGAVVDPGYEAIIHIQDTTDWSVVDGDSGWVADDVTTPNTRVFVDAWVDSVPGRQYQAQVWVRDPNGSVLNQRTIRFTGPARDGG